VAKARIGNCIRQLRFEANEMTQKDLAEAVGCTRQTIILLEQERYVPSLALAFRISRVFQRPLEEIFFFEEIA
jgi:putative transcriptional regulator